MSFDLYDYADDKGRNQIKKWANSLQKKELAKLNARLDMLKRSGTELFPQILTGTPTAGILKLRVHGSVQLRPMLCKGPLCANKEFTLLIGAKEVQSDFDPKKADQIADKRRQDIVDNPERRVEHERTS